MKVRLVTVTAMLLGAVVLAGSSAAASDDAASEETAVSGPPPSSSEWRGDSDEPGRAADAVRLSQLARSLGTALDGTDGRSLAFGRERSMSVFETADGGLCFASDDRSIEGDAAGTCGRGFPENGIAATYSSGPGAPTTLIGLVARDVSDVRIVDSAGREHEVEVIGGAIWWTAPAGAAAAQLHVVRDGRTHVDSDLFAGARG